jgi:LCP family protein required for cell wall assembly
MILVRVDPQRQAISMLSIPRDLQIELPGHGIQKINAAYAFGGPRLAIETVRRVLGVPVNHYLDVNFRGFFELVQKLGGIYIQVDRRYYNPNVPGAPYAPIDLHPGYQRLNGNQALAYVRFRHLDTDFIRADRQQLFLLELKRQAAGRIGLADVPSLLKILEGNVVFDSRSLSTVIGLARDVLGLPKDRIFRTTLEARAGPSYVYATPAQIAASVQRWENPPLPGGGSSLGTGGRVDHAHLGVTIENGGAGFEAALYVAAELRRRGYPAQSEGDAPTALAGRSGLYFLGSQEGAARQLAGVLAGGVGAELAPSGQPASEPLLLVVGPGFPVTRPLKPPPRPKRRRATPPAIVADPSIRQKALAVLPRGGVPVLVPTSRPASSRLSDLEGIRKYDIRVGERDYYPAVCFTFQAPGVGSYWDVQETTMPDPPIVRSSTTTVVSPRRRYQLTYDGAKLRTLAWQRGRTWYWISNSLDSALTDRQMVAIADGMRDLYPRARRVARPRLRPVALPHTSAGRQGRP